MGVLNEKMCKKIEFLFVSLNSTQTSQIIKLSNAKMNATTKTIRYKTVDPRQSITPFSFPKSPPQLTTEQINKMSIYMLKELELQYDKYLEDYCQLFMLYGNIDEVIDIRNYITFRIGKLTRDKIKLENREKYRL